MPWGDEINTAFVMVAVTVLVDVLMTEMLGPASE